MNFYEILATGLDSLSGISPSEIKYSQWHISVWLAAILAMLVMLKSLFSRNSDSQKCSGYLIPAYYHRGFSRQLVDLLFKTTLALGVGMLLVALADPFVPTIKTESVLKESKERIDLIDVSTSKGWLFENIGKSAGRLGREAHLKFLKMRQGKNDRVSLWLFSTKATKVESFIADDELYYQQVEDAPYVITSPGNPWLPQFNYPASCHVNIPESRLELVFAEGGTFLDTGLRSVIRHFDEEGDKRIKRKAVIIETDAAVDVFPKTELQELRKKNIHPYFLYIKPNEECETLAGNMYKGLVNAQRLKLEIEKYGGKFYDIQNADSLNRAYQDIDRLEAVELKETHVVDKLYLFQAFILLGILIAVIAITGILVAEIFGIYP
ncbi:MAG: VWA domain-containing protein [Candidatus Yanofskybacteria bacterium]|nr:VWA domain-containing protein [Candidatus Yanofskybacteria bacterium]